MVRSESFLEIHLFSPKTSPLPTPHSPDNIVDKTEAKELM